LPQLVHIRLEFGDRLYDGGDIVFVQKQVMGLGDWQRRTAAYLPSASP
jgi:hypothetical protein